MPSIVNVTMPFVINDVMKIKLGPNDVTPVCAIFGIHRNRPFGSRNMTVLYPIPHYNEMWDYSGA